MSLFIILMEVDALYLNINKLRKSNVEFYLPNVLLKKNFLNGFWFYNTYHLTPLTKLKKDSLYPLSNFF